MHVLTVYYQCLLGKSCGKGGMCLSHTRWCDGTINCPDGEDESQCCKAFKSVSQFSTQLFSGRIYFLIDLMFHSSPPRGQLHAGELFIKQPDLDARVC